MLKASFPKGNIDETFIKIIGLNENPELEAGWEPIVVSFHDDGSGCCDADGKYISDHKQWKMPEWQNQLFAILADIYQFGADLFKNWQELPPHEQLEFVKTKLGTVTITKYDGHTGTPKQEWIMTEAWPHSVNFGDLCYSSDPSMDIEVTWRFKKCTTNVL